MATRQFEERQLLLAKAPCFLPHGEHSRKIEPSPKRERERFSLPPKVLLKFSPATAAGKAPEQQDRTFHGGISSSGWRDPPRIRSSPFFSPVTPGRDGGSVVGKFVKGKRGSRERGEEGGGQDSF